ncbi:MAG: DoxX family protein [Bacteroidales bacterium]|jgi:uncharacterized membrane protein YphA (DoxX/SURF4 family)|nr:DoxX family protein [Bacteroidales bacterium]
MRYIGRLFRIIVGLVFVFSGFVKAVDPWGTAYKITEYLGAFDLSSLIDFFPPLPIFLSVILCSLEFILGIVFLSGYLKKTSSLLVGLMMLFFTILTLIDALTNKVSDCGCFGDAILLTNWQTFWKNIVLDILLIISFIFDDFMIKRNTTNKRNSILFSLIVALLVLCFSIRNAVYEPVIDFRPWAKGNRMVPKLEDQKAPINYATYKNLNTNEEREFSMDELMEEYSKDTTFYSSWQWISSRTLSSNTISADGFSMIGILGTEDKAFEFLSHQGISFIFAINDLSSLSKEIINKLSDFEKKASGAGFQTAIITSSQQNNWKDFIKNNNWENVDIYSTDDKAIKTMLRSKAGVVMLNNGVVEEKWSYRALPSFEKVLKKIEKKEKKK